MAYKHKKPEPLVPWQAVYTGSTVASRYDYDDLEDPVKFWNMRRTYCKLFGQYQIETYT
jgi:hypothetical protein